MNIAEFVRIIMGARATPNDLIPEVFFPENFVGNYFDVVSDMPIGVDEDGSIIDEKPFHQV